MSEKRVQFAVRVSPTAKEKLDHMAWQHHVPTARLIRAMLAVAHAHMDEVEEKLHEF
jgi:hypothetical protein